jgi:hypothetical protein
MYYEYSVLCIIIIIIIIIIPLGHWRFIWVMILI